MTDAEIIKGTECCSSKSVVCKDCPYCGQYNCVQELEKDTIDLINRQREEIEKLTNHILDVTKMIEESQRDTKIWKDIAHRESSYVKVARAEAIKEFAERLKSRLITVTYMNFDDTIDNLVKEMAGDTE